MTETIKSAKELARFYMQKDIPCFISGPPGVGKSELWEQIAEESEASLIDLRLGTMDPVDLLGLQCIIDGKTVHNKPEWWPDEKRDGPKQILLCDEMTDCNRAMQSAAYQLILNRRVGPHKLPKGCYPCAAGNRRIDKAASQALSTALANRFGHIEVEANHEAFIEWGNRHDIDPLITGFIRHRPQLLHSMEGADLRAFPTPRTWAMASKCVSVNDATMRFRLMRGIIGEGPAGEFKAFMEVLDLPDIEDILADPKNTPIPEKPASKYALSSMLARYAERKNFEKILTYVGRREFGRDFETVTALDATGRDPSLCDTKAWLNWANRNQDTHL